MPKLASEFILVATLFVSSVASAVDYDFTTTRAGSWFFESTDVVRMNEYDASHPPALVFKDPASISSCRLDGRSCDAKKPISLTTNDIAPVVREIVVTTVDGEATTIKVKLLSEVGTKFRMSGRSVLEKDILVAPTQYVMVLSHEGKLKYYFHPNGTVTDFKAHDVGDRRYYSYSSIDGANELVNSFGRRTLLDSRFRPMKTFKETMDTHEFVLLGEDHYIFHEYAASTGAKKCRIDQKIRESKNGKVSVLFDTRDFDEKYHLPNPIRIPFEGRECEVRSHLNALQVVGDGKYLIGTGEHVVMWDSKRKQADWIFGTASPSQFAVSNDLGFSLIHTPTWFPNEARLVVFDNGMKNLTLTPKSANARILDLKMDVVTKRILSSRVVTIPNGPSTYAGNVAVDGDVFTAALGRHKGEWDVVEYSEGKQTFALSFGPLERFYNYRVYRADPLR